VARASTLLLLFSMSYLYACGHSRPPERTTEPEVVLRAPSGAELRVKVELARTDQERMRGLMFRQKLEDGHGMLFLFERPDRLKFWMKNTYIPLDMLFIDEHRRVIAVEENAEPLTLKSRGPDADSQYVLEVPGGWTRTHGVGPGVEVRFVGVE
jgi:uncharacterized membrane protein (UPF0127 family)